VGFELSFNKAAFLSANNSITKFLKDDQIRKVNLSISSEILSKIYAASNVLVSSFSTLQSSSVLVSSVLNVGRADLTLYDAGRAVKSML